MIYSFGAKNYFSFREGMSISFELNSKVPKSVSQGKKFTTVMGIEGANASGKTSVLKCLRFLEYFALASFENKEKDSIGIDSFFKNSLPSDFYIDFEYAGVRYIYELTLTDDEVLREALYKKVTRKTLLFERLKNEITKSVSDLQELSVMKLRSNASVISSVSRYKINKGSSDIQNVLDFFYRFFGNVGLFGMLRDSHHPIKGASEFYYDKEEAFLFAKSIITKCDLGISDIVIHRKKNSSDEYEYLPVFHHNTDCGSEENRWLTHFDQSSGTIALYNKLYLYWCALASGGVLIMDEFDVHCHPMLLPKILDLFLDPVSNPKNAQFIFTAHNSDIIDSLGKYRVVLVNKEKSESYCYRLDEIPGDLVRNDRSISPLYRDGKLGGVPNYG
jgi:AAA15 family ATPase/GTPase